MKSIHRSSELLLLDGPPDRGGRRPINHHGQRILLSDFGIARNTDDISGLKGTNMTMGTIGYTAPHTTC
jgi:serine/threonine protein kinase